MSESPQALKEQLVSTNSLSSDRWFDASPQYQHCSRGPLKGSIWFLGLFERECVCVCVL